MTGRPTPVMTPPSFRPKGCNANPGKPQPRQAAARLMQIELNPNGIRKPSQVRPIVRRRAAPAAAGQASRFSHVPWCVSLDGGPVVRPEKVREARVMLSNGTYPPVELLVRIAALLAAKLHN